MKVLHTSDWHLGHSLYGFDRSEEQRSMLDQIVELVREQKPDALVVSGDIYHTGQPSAAVQTLFSETMVRVHDAHPGIVCVVTAGNHDSSSKHDIFQTPWKALNVFTVGALEREEENLDNHIVTVDGKGFIAAVPYAYERNIPEGFYQRLLDRVAERNTDNLPVVLMAHTAVNGCDFTGHDNATEFMVGGIDSLSLDTLGQGYDYLALGHIHRPQYIRKDDTRARYCGTPIPVSFDEKYEHSVSMVELSRHGEQPTVTTIPIYNPHPLKTIPDKGYGDWESVRKQFEDFPADSEAYVLLNVEVENALPATANVEANRIADTKRCRFCHVNARRKKQVEGTAQTMTTSEFQQKSPLEMVRLYAKDKAKTFDEDMEKLFEEVVKEVAENERNK